jgi:hypothetical protein
MKRTYAAASIYGIIDRMDVADIQRWLGWHKKLKYPPRFINVFTAARFNEAPNILRQVRDSLPDTTPVWRGYDGKDAWGNVPPETMKWDDSNYYLRLWNAMGMGPTLAANLWYTRRVKPYLPVIRETKSIVMLLNEANAIFNAPFETELIRILGEEGVRAAAFRWNTGTPKWAEYWHELIAAEVAMAEKYDTLIGPHEYSGLTAELQNSLINRNQTLVKLFKKAPDVFIGEFGLALAKKVEDEIQLDPDAGWLEMGVSEDAYTRFIRETAMAWYVPNKVSFSVFDWIGWGRNGSFGVGRYEKVLDGLIDLSELMSFSVEDAAVDTPTTPIIMERPAEVSSSVRARVKSIPGGTRNLRARYNYAATDVGDLKAGDVVRRFDIPTHDGLVNATTSGKWCFVEVLDGDTVKQAGWTWKDNIVWESVTATQETPVVVDPTPEPQPDPTVPPPETLPDGVPLGTVTHKRYSLEIKTTEAQHQLIEQALMLILSGIGYLGQALGNSELTIKTDVITA